MKITLQPVANPWLPLFRPNPQAPLRLFCFPFAGGSALAYRHWGTRLPGVELCPVELPGRGTRLPERPFTQLPPLVEAMAEALLPHLDKPFAFFGHSMGALTSFELARYLRRVHNREPLHLFVSAHRAPHLPRVEAPTYLLPDQELVEELRQLDGTPEELLNHPEMMQLMLPIIRADFEVCERYDYHEEAAILTCPVTALGGLTDGQVSRWQLEGWREQTRGSCTVRMFPGGHFYLLDEQSSFIPMMARTLHELIQEIG